MPLEIIGVNTLFYIDTIFREVQILKPKFQFVKSYDEAVKKLENALKDVEQHGIVMNNNHMLFAMLFVVVLERTF